MKNNNENNEKGISISNKEENKKNLSDKIIPKTAKKNSFDILDDNKINIIDKNNKKKKIYTKTPCKGLKNIEKQKPTKTSKNNKLNLQKKVKDLQIIQIEKTNDNNISNKIVHNPKANICMTDLNKNEKSENKIKTIEINNKSGNINLLREIDNNRNDKDNSIILTTAKKEKKKLNISIKNEDIPIQIACKTTRNKYFETNANINNLKNKKQTKIKNKQDVNEFRNRNNNTTKSMKYLTKDNTKESLKRDKSTINNKNKSIKIFDNSFNITKLNNEKDTITSNNNQKDHKKEKSEILNIKIREIKIDEKNKIINDINQKLKREINDLKNKNNNLEEKDKENENKITILEKL